MDPDERQRQREARRRARQGNAEEDEAPAETTRRSSNVNDTEDSSKTDDSARQQQEEEERREREEQEQKKRRERQREDEDRQEREEAERKKKQDEEERERDVKEERQKKDEDTKRRREIEEKEEAKKKKKPDKKRKGLGGLSLEKKRLLKQLIMQKAAEEMKAEMKKKQEVKDNHLKAVVPELNTDTDNKDKMVDIVKKLYEKLCKLEGDKYDWELQLRNIDFEINELTLKVNNVKGKFVKPVLKKVSKSEAMWSKLEKREQKNQIGFRDQLKSTGQNKFALDEKDETHTQKNTDWRENLKPKDSDNVEEVPDAAVPVS